jgi:uncharacterized membrane protein (UPF0127 family)
VGVALYVHPDEPLPIFVSNKAPFTFELADTESKRTQGLSGRTELPAGYGMLFVFERAGRYGFWMKDMHVSIDIIWLTDDGVILDIEENVAPETYPTPFYPPVPVRYVLETREGEATAQGWRAGTRIALPKEAQ